MPQIIATESEVFTVTKEISSGNFSDVFLVEEARTRNKRTLKLLKPFKSPSTVYRLREDLKTLSSVGHPNIPKIHTFDLDKRLNRYFFTTDYIEGKEIFAATEGKEIKYIESLIQQSLSALAFLHSHKVTHFDVKCQNLLVSEENGNPKVFLVDFGLASHYPETITHSLGSVKYVAPEIILQFRKLDHRLDLYPLGIVAYRILTRQFPFPDSFERKDILEWHINGKLEFPESPKLPDYLIEIVKKLAEKNPDRRYIDAASPLNVLSAHTNDAAKNPAKPTHLIEGPLVGRDAEIDYAEKILNDLPKTLKTPPLELITGERGAGKTRLLEDICNLAKLKNYRTVWINGDRSRNFIEQLETLFPFLKEEKKEPLSMIPAGLSPEEIDRYLVKRSEWSIPQIDALLKQMSNQPTVFILDDFDRGGPLAWEFIRQLTNKLAFDSLNGEGIPFWIVASADLDDQNHPTFTKFTKSLWIKKNPLNHLTRSDVAIYLKNFCPNLTENDPVIQKVTAACNGNSLLLEEISKKIVPSMLAKEKIEWEQVPRSIDEAYQAHISRLTDVEKKALSILCLLHHSTDSSNISTIMGRPTEEIVSALHRLEREGLVRYSFLTMRYQPISGALATTLARLIPDEEKRKLHNQITVSLEKHPQPDIEVLAFHADRGGNVRAPRYLIQAANQNEYSLQLPRAILHLERALSHCSEDHPLRPKIERRLGRLYFFAEAFTAAEAMMKAALARESPQSFEDSYLLGAALMKQGNLKAAEDVYEHGVKLLGPNAPPYQTICLQNAIAHIYLKKGEIQKAVNLFEATNTWAQRLSAGARANVTNNNLEVALAAEGALDRALWTAQEKLRFFESTRDPYKISRAHEDLGDIYLKRLEFTSATKSFEESLKILEKTGDHIHLFPLLRKLILIFREQGLFKEALSHLEKLTQNKAFFGIPVESSKNCLTAGDLYISLNLLTPAGEALDKAEWLAKSEEEDPLLGLIQLSRARIQKETGKDENARKMLEELLQFAHAKRMKWLEARINYELAEIYIEREDIKLAELYLNRTEDESLGKDLQIRLRLARIKSNSMSSDADIYSLTGDLDPIANDLKTTKSKNLLWELLWIKGRLLRRSGRTEEAEDAFSGANETILSISESIPESYRGNFLQKHTYKKLLSEWKVESVVEEDTGLKELYLPDRIFSSPKGGDTMSKPTIPTDVILDINKHLMKTLDPKFLFRMIMDYAIGMSKAERGILFIRGGEEKLEIALVRNVSKNDGLTTQFSQKVSQKVLETGSSILTSDTANVKSFVAVPLKLQEAVIGVIYLDTQIKQEPINQSVIGILEAFAGQAAIALENSRTFEEQNRQYEDIKTKVKNLEGMLRVAESKAAASPPTLEHGKTYIEVEKVKTLDRYEDEIVKKTLNMLSGNKRQTALRLGITRATLDRKLNRQN